MHELAQRTGGRVLSFDDVESINLFDRDGLELPVSPMPVLGFTCATCCIFIDH